MSMTRCPRHHGQRQDRGVTRGVVHQLISVRVEKSYTTDWTLAYRIGNCAVE